jgi:GTP pyrophosphokinase
LVSACDKLHNAESILLDLTETGSSMFVRFTTSREQTHWYYYREWARIFTGRQHWPGR